MSLRKRHMIIVSLIVAACIVALGIFVVALDYFNVIEINRYGISTYTEPSKEKLIAGITKTSRLKKVQVYTTMHMTDQSGESDTVIDSRMSDDFHGFYLNEQMTVKRGSSKSTTQYIKTDGEECKYKITQQGLSGGAQDWTEKKIPIKKLQGMNCLAYGFDLLDMDLVSAEEKDGLTVYKVKFSDYYQKKMNEKYKGEKYNVIEYECTYWVNEANIVERSKVWEHVIYESTDGTFNVDYKHDSKLVKYNEDIDFQF